MAVFSPFLSVLAEQCMEAMRGMLRGKTIIVPSALMRAATTAQDVYKRQPRRCS